MRAQRIYIDTSVIGGCFDAEFAAYCDTRDCVSVANGLDALHLTLRAFDIGPGDEVIVPSNTFIATWLAVDQVGAVPVPVEPEDATFNLDPARIEAAVTERTRAIIADTCTGIRPTWIPSSTSAAAAG